MCAHLHQPRPILHRLDCTPQLTPSPPPAVRPVAVAVVACDACCIRAAHHDHHQLPGPAPRALHSQGQQVQVQEGVMGGELCGGGQARSAVSRGAQARGPEGVLYPTQPVQACCACREFQQSRLALEWQSRSTVVLPAPVTCWVRW